MASPNSINRNYRRLIATEGQTVFTWDFWQPDDVLDSEIYVRQENDLLVITTDYTIDTATKTITLVTGATAGDEIFIYRILSKVRNAAFSTATPWSTASINAILDRLTAYNQDHDWVQSQFEITINLLRGQNCVVTPQEAGKGAFTIDRVYYRCDSGSIDFTISVNDSAHTDFTSIAIGTTQTNIVPTATWSIDPNDQIQIEFANNNDAQGIVVTIQATKTG